MSVRASTVQSGQIELTLAGPRRRRYRLPPIGLAGAVLVILLIAVAIVGPSLTRDPAKISGVVFKGPSGTYWFGTDGLGRDYYARVVSATRLSMSLSFVAIAIGGGLAVTIGMGSAYFGGAVDLVVQRLIDVLLAFPGLVLVMFLVAVFGANFFEIALSLGLILAPGLSRVVRSCVLVVVNEAYVDAERVLGASNLRIMARHVFPNIVAPLIVFVSAGLGAVILAEGGLSFLGLGIRPPTPSWGRMLSDSRTQLAQPWLSIFPGIAMTVAILGYNLIGDALRDMLDPRLRGR